MSTIDVQAPQIVAVPDPLLPTPEPDPWDRLPGTGKLYLYTLDPLLTYGESQAHVATMPLPVTADDVARKFGGGRWRALVKDSTGRLCLDFRFATWGAVSLRDLRPEGSDPPLAEGSVWENFRRMREASKPAAPVEDPRMARLEAMVEQLTRTVAEQRQPPPSSDRSLSERFMDRYLTSLLAKEDSRATPKGALEEAVAMKAMLEGSGGGSDLDDVAKLAGIMEKLMGFGQRWGGPKPAPAAAATVAAPAASNPDSPAAPAAPAGPGAPSPSQVTAARYVAGASLLVDGFRAAAAGSLAEGAAAATAVSLEALLGKELLEFVRTKSDGEVGAAVAALVGHAAPGETKLLEDDRVLDFLADVLAQLGRPVTPADGEAESGNDAAVEEEPA